MEKYKTMLTSTIIVWGCFAVSLFLVFFNYFAYGNLPEIKQLTLTLIIALCAVFFTLSAKSAKKQISQQTDKNIIDTDEEATA